MNKTLKTLAIVHFLSTDQVYCHEGDKEWLPLSTILHELEPAEKPPLMPSSSLSVIVVKQAKSRGVFIILAIFFGFLGIHDFYAGRYRHGAGLLASTLLVGWISRLGLLIGLIVTLVEIFSVTEDGEGQKMT